MALQFCRSMVLTEKALELFREQRKRNSDTLVTDILWLASAEFGRQRSAGFGWTTDRILNGPIVRRWEPIAGRSALELIAKGEQA